MCRDFPKVGASLAHRDARNDDQGTPLVKGQQALLNGRPDLAIGHFLQAASYLGDLSEMLVFNLELARQRWLKSREGQAPKVAVCGWELAHNPAGRVMTLVEAYEPHARTDIIGCIFPLWGRKLWAPVRETSVPCHFIVLDDESRFVRQALQLVLAHPYDVVHLSKPRIVNIVLGLLYKLIWGATVYMDIDDEELGFVKATEPLKLEDWLADNNPLPPLENLRGIVWTRLAVGLVERFDGITVSNPALQRQYGGQVLPHVRPMKRFDPSKAKTHNSRTRFGIPLDKKVVLFYGTPRAHKGLLETGRAIASLNRDDVCYVIVGSFPKAGLKEEVSSIPGLECYFVEGQPYDKAADIVAMGDFCVLLQDSGSLASQYQLPAKLMDAMAMGLVVFAQLTPALEHLKDRGALIPVTVDSLKSELEAHLNAVSQEEISQNNRLLFEQFYSVESVAPMMRELLQNARPSLKGQMPWHGLVRELVNGELTVSMLGSK